MSSILNSRLNKLEKELECMLKSADKLTYIQKTCFQDCSNTQANPQHNSEFSSNCTNRQGCGESRNRNDKMPSINPRTSAKSFDCQKKITISAACDSKRNEPENCLNQQKRPPTNRTNENHKAPFFRKKLPSYREESNPCGHNSEVCSLPSKNGVIDEKELMDEKAKRVKAECDAQQMKTEIDLLRMQLEDLIESKKTAIELSQDLQNKYTCLLNEKQEIVEKMCQLQKNNQSLNMKLEKEINSRKTYLQETQKTATKTKEAIEYKLEEIQMEAAKSTKLMAVNTEKLAKTLKDKEKRLKQMCQKTEEMNKAIEEKDKEIKQVTKEKKQLELCLDENKLWNQKLREVNDKLAQTVKEYYNKILTGKNEIESLRQEIKCYRDKLMEMQNKHEKYKEELEKIKLKNHGDENERQNYEKELEEYKEKEKNYQFKIKMLCNELQKMEEAHKETTKQMKCEMQKLMQEHNKLKCECSEMQKKLVQFRTADEKRRKCIEEELRLFTSFVNEKESILLKEKEELSCLVNELTSVIKQHKMRICELSKTNKQQEEMLECQCKKLAMQEKSLQHKTKENEYLAMKNQHLEEEIKKVKKSSEEKKGKESEEYKYLERQLTDIRNLYSEEKKKVACKEKTIQNQNKLISELKCELNKKKTEASDIIAKYNKSCEQLRRQNDEIKRLCIELETEKKEKNSLIEELRQMESKQKSLESKVAILEKTVEQYYCCTSKDITKKEEMIKCLQQEIAKQRTEFCQQKSSIQEEKDKAITAAKFATQKLYDTVTDFQQQIETQKKVQKFLTGLLGDKDILECKDNDTTIGMCPTDEECSEKTFQDDNPCCSSSENSKCGCDPCSEINNIFKLTRKFSNTNNPTTSMPFRSSSVTSKLHNSGSYKNLCKPNKFESEEDEGDCSKMRELLRSVRPISTTTGALKNKDADCSDITNKNFKGNFDIEERRPDSPW